MKWSSMLAALVAFVALAVQARAAEPFAEATLGTQGKIVAGQQISVLVDVYVPNFFTSAPQFPSIEMTDAIVTMPDERAQNLDKTVNGEQFFGIRRTYLVIPQLAGDYSLPTVTIPFAYAREPGQSTQASVTLPPLTFHVGDVPSQGDSTAFAATDARLTQNLDRDPADLKVGDSLVRTVTLFAGGTQAMMLPQLEFDVPEGVNLYRRAPALTDGVTGPDRKTGSQRSERVTYVMEKEGKLTLPALSVDWFDTGTMQARHAELPAILLVVKAAPAPAGVIAPELPKSSDAPHILSARLLERAALALAAILVVGALLYRLLPRFLHRWRVHREEVARGEPARFRQLSLALNSGDAKAVYAALGNWTRTMGYPNIADWAAASGDKTAEAALTTFERDLFGSGSPTGHASMRVLGSALLGWRVRNKRHLRTPVALAPALPPLNP